ncbi:hypothetical protein WH95_16370 [Kiloniella litopenaei]|uniref:Reverse transcriptase domain-containing protein n=1 Tax=Kiloniella litopenaei TaxID=1549748 RepID=A0A0M2R1Q1_9PROT|nr:antiviral reverse transcriptase Drt3b [Kiloniella litopenaei]KKJ75802.1 hypothetical protein WH95_16370 [Kiloniella litopenaei]
MSARKLNIKYKKERTLLSDVLPYEVPLSFSNRHFYSFVLENKIECINADNNISLRWKKGSKALNSLMHILFSLPLNPKKVADKKIEIKGFETTFEVFNNGAPGKGDSAHTNLTPFSFKINHKKSEFRELTIPHPRSQMSVIEFYDRHKETILYYTSLSNFSLRRPNKISTYKFLKDRLHFSRLANTEIDSIIEEHNKEHENLKSFFSYKEISNIYKFYESFLYHKCEKRYDNLEKLDVSKCFDSIYTHSIVWAVIGKSASKEFITKANNSFSGRFDKLMQRLHYGETNGIVIGPEFSRVFAEIILQRVDRNLEERLKKTPNKLKFKHDYEIYRYVDDYFIFYNNAEDKTLIVNELQIALKEYKLSLNSNKAEDFNKPIITDITIAKNQISKFLSKSLQYKCEEVSDDCGEIKTVGSISVNANRLITTFKTIIKTNNVDYKDMLNYTFAVIEKKIEKILYNYHFVEKTTHSERQLVNALLHILEFVFFIYTVSPKVNTTIRLCRVIRSICEFLLGMKNREYSNQIHKLIFDEISFVIKKNNKIGYSQIETLYLLIALTQLGKDFWLEESALIEYLGLEPEKIEEVERNFDYFSITVSLFYMRNKKRYDHLRKKIEKIALFKVETKKKTRFKEAEMTMLALDIISCPYVSKSTKQKILSSFNVTELSTQNDIINFKSKSGRRQLWFTNWDNFNFGKELDAKQSQEVY